MARFEFKSGVTARSTPERAFDYFADHRHVARVLEGVTKWDPIGTKAAGVGARYNVELVAFGLPLDGVLRINHWRRPEEIGWVSESGPIKQDGGFTFKKVPDGVRIELRIAYEPPASFLGAALARPLDHMVRERLEKALERIRDRLEAQD
jgi:Polyketide cyclase / dehydrase and lipid transport